MVRSGMTRVPGAVGSAAAGSAASTAAAARAKATSDFMESSTQTRQSWPGGGSRGSCDFGDGLALSADPQQRPHGGGDVRQSVTASRRHEAVSVNVPACGEQPDATRFGITRTVVLEAIRA